MAKEKFLMVSLEETRAKDVAELISNNTARKILNYLIDNESATESEISEKLKIPLPTVHYNIQNLLKADLIEAEEFHYSKKGREVLHYRLVNKYIIISPKPLKGIKGKLRSILTAVLAVLGVSAITEILSRKFLMPTPQIITEAARDTMMFAEKAAPVGGGAPQQIIPHAASWYLSLGLWVLVGGLLGIAIYTILDYYKNKR